MKHTSELRWDDVRNEVSGQSLTVKSSLVQGEEMYQEMLELFQYSGSTAQGLADQLFKEVWEARSNPGVQAEITYDVTAGALTGVTIVQAGTGYTDGVGYTLSVFGGNSDAVISYDVVGGSLTNAAVDAAGTGYPDGAGQAMTNEPAPGVVFDTQASATEVTMAQDAIDAMTAIHQLYQAATNVAVTQSDRLAALRRMS
jgi:hypothetical protein